MAASQLELRLRAAGREPPFREDMSTAEEE
jgi:hypothetical protein